jgi:CBS domain-containing protein
MLCQRLALTVRRSDEVVHAAEIMREKHVGFLVVVEPDPVDGFMRPVGVLTDRDIVVSVVAQDLDPRSVRVGEIMTLNPVIAHKSDAMEAALRKMRDFGIRRLPIIDARGELVGILAMDDVLECIAGDAEDLVAGIRHERQVEGVMRP